MAKKIGSGWKKRMRKIDGKRRLVKVRRRAGREQVRVLNKRNLTDRSARRMGHKRKKFRYSSTDSGPRRHKIRR